MSEKDPHELGSGPEIPSITLPEFDYGPGRPKAIMPKIGLIGCGGISKNHLEAYTRDGWEVVAVFDKNREAAEKRKSEFVPNARICTSAEELCAIPEINVVDVALHPEPRTEVIPVALKAGKHVLSQKPFVLDLEKGAALAELADTQGKLLAVNQNGRWAPYVRWSTLALRSDLIGCIQNVAIDLFWDHTWCKGTPFERIHQLLLYDFGIHWIDMIRCWFGDRRAKKVFASVERISGQDMRAPLLASVLFSFDNGHATLNLNGSVKTAASETIRIIGSKGSITCQGDICNANSITLITNEGKACATLEGTWFSEGFRGTMGELLCAIEEARQPENGARNNLRSLELAFAAIASADTGMAKIPGEVTFLGDTCRIMD